MRQGLGVTAPSSAVANMAWPMRAVDIPITASGVARCRRVETTSQGLQRLESLGICAALRKYALASSTIAAPIIGRPVACPVGARWARRLSPAKWLRQRYRSDNDGGDDKLAHGSFPSVDEREFHSIVNALAEMREQDQAEHDRAGYRKANEQSP